MNHTIKEAKWTFRMTVISTVATVLTLVVPVLIWYFTQSDAQKIIDVVTDPQTRMEIKEDIRETVSELPPLPEPPNFEPPIGKENKPPFTPFD